MMNGSTYHQLMIFLTIVQEGSIRGAARKLEMSPPSVSQALKLLEKHTGLPLLKRTTRQMDLTEAGRLLYEQAEPSITALAHTMESVHDLSHIPSGKIRLTIPRIAYQLFLKPIYAEFCRTYPLIQLEVSISDATINLINEGFDAGIRLGHRVEGDMISKPLTPPMKEALFACDSYLKQYGMPRTIAELRQHRMIQYRFITSNQLAPLNLYDKGHNIQVDMPVSMIVNDTDMIVDAALKGMGIGCIVTPLVQNELNNGRLKPLLKNYWFKYLGLHVYFPQHSQKAKRIRVLIDFLCSKAIKSW